MTLVQHRIRVAVQRNLFIRLYRQIFSEMVYAPNPRDPIYVGFFCVDRTIEYLSVSVSTDVFLFDIPTDGRIQ